jgi:hypothetical protein
MAGLAKGTKQMMMKPRLVQLFFLVAAASYVSLACAQEQFPIMNKVADRVIQKYRESRALNLWLSVGGRRARRNSESFSCSATTPISAGPSSTE